MLTGNFAGVALLSYVGVGLQTKAMKVLLRQGFLRLAPLAQDKLLALPCNKKAACAAFLLLRQGSNICISFLFASSICHIYCTLYLISVQAYVTKCNKMKKMFQ